MSTFSFVKNHQNREFFQKRLKATEGKFIRKIVFKINASLETECPHCNVVFNMKRLEIIVRLRWKKKIVHERHAVCIDKTKIKSNTKKLTNNKSHDSRDFARVPGPQVVYVTYCIVTTGWPFSWVVVHAWETKGTRAHVLWDSSDSNRAAGRFPHIFTWVIIVPNNETTLSTELENKNNNENGARSDYNAAHKNLSFSVKVEKSRENSQFLSELIKAVGMYRGLTFLRSTRDYGVYSTENFFEDKSYISHSAESR